MEFRTLPGDPGDARDFSWSDLLGEEPRRDRAECIDFRWLVPLLLVIGTGIGVWWPDPTQTQLAIADSEPEPAEGAGGEDPLWTKRFPLLASAMTDYRPELARALSGLVEVCKQRADSEADAVLFAVLSVLASHAPAVEEQARRSCARLNGDAFPATRRLLDAD